MSGISERQEVHHVAFTTTQTGLPVAGFTLAVNRPVRSGQERKADFIDCVAWRSTAEFVAKYFAKGQQVAIEGQLQVRDWEDKQGNKRRAYEVVVDKAHFADSKRDGMGGSGPARPAPDVSADGFEDIQEDDGLPF